MCAVAHSFLHEFRVFELRTSQLGGTHFTNWAIASAPEQLFLSRRGMLKIHEPNHLHPMMSFVLKYNANHVERQNKQHLPITALHIFPELILFYNLPAAVTM